MHSSISFLKTKTLFLCVTGFVISPAVLGAPIIPGLHQKHPLSEAQKGEVLIEELRCASCHDGMGNSPSAPGPHLSSVSSRLHPEFLKNFILNPSAHDAGTKMPKLLGSRSPEEQEELATELSAYLLSLESTPAKPISFPEGAATKGEELFHKTGCVACHTPRDGNQEAQSLEGSLHLDHVGEKYLASGLVSFLQAPLEVRPDGRMPDMKLSRNEAELLSAFLLGPEAPTSESVILEPSQVAAGKAAFTSLRCIACHEIDSPIQDSPLPSAGLPPLAELNLDQGCLSENPQTAPNYELSAEQRSAIKTALKTPAGERSADDAVKMRLTQLNCIACHERDDYGGVRPELDGYFHSSEEALGDHARIPPTLTLTGAKLRPDWMNKVFYEGESVRPYMHTRMPQFGSVAMDGLTQLLGETDKMEPFEYKPLDKESTPMMKNGAHLLLGDQGLNCIACHNYNGKESPSMKGLDLMTSYQRLQPAWFDAFMRDPGKFREGIIMPSFWPGGQALQTEILDGNTEDQLRSLWFNFSLGRSARDPSGLDVSNPELTVTDKVLTYRGRSQVAGYRGIAVGFPKGLNYSFDAGVGSFTGIWQGEFVSVGWHGQGSGDFRPIGSFTKLTDDIQFLAEPLSPWPPKPVRGGKEANPDPLYPRQYGYKFKGFTIGEDDIPTLRYDVGDIAISEVSKSMGSEAEPFLERTLSFTTEKATTIYFRPLVGDIKMLSEDEFQITGLTLKLLDSTAAIAPKLRPSPSEGTENELIIRCDLPAGESSLSIQYTPQP